MFCDATGLFLTRTMFDPSALTVPLARTPVSAVANITGPDPSSFSSLAQPNASKNVSEAGSKTSGLFLIAELQDSEHTTNSQGEPARQCSS
jgi:hypothetical protein